MLKIFKILMKPEMRILPGQLAFFLVLTIIPLVALIATFAAALSISTETIRLAISESVPKEVAGIINSIMAGNGINFNIIIFYISAFILASNGTYSMVNTSNEIYKVEPKNILFRRGKAILMTFILMGLFIFLLLVPVFGTNLFEIIKNATGNSTVVRVIQEMLKILKYPLILVILFINIKLMYIIAPDREIPSKSTNKGALFTRVNPKLRHILCLQYLIRHKDVLTNYKLFEAYKIITGVGKVTVAPKILTFDLLDLASFSLEEI